MAAFIGKPTDTTINFANLFYSFFAIIKYTWSQAYFSYGVPLRLAPHGDVKISPSASANCKLVYDS